MTKPIWIAMIALPSLLAQDGAISAERIREHDRFLSLDLLEGRGVGQRGGDLATEYIATQFALAGAKPAGDNGTYFQKVPLVGIETQPDASLSASASGKTVDFQWLDDFVGVSQTQQPETRFEAQAIFVGHGITAPEFQWDDFKGVDVTGKLLVVFTNEPPSTDPKFFDGRALTYYGRWVYTVSYTHLDVYKRQVLWRDSRYPWGLGECQDFGGLPGGVGERAGRMGADQHRRSFRDSGH